MTTHLTLPRHRPIVSIVLGALLLAGCGIGKESILFVTTTSFALDVDSKPPVFQLGYSRQEGTLAPVFENGQVLPQLTSFRFDAGGQPERPQGQAPTSAPARGGVHVGVGQSFATGTAALLLAKYIGTNARPNNVNSIIPDSEIGAPHAIQETIAAGGTSRRQRYFFGTDTTLGLKVTMSLETGGYPDSFTLGWKRKELAYVPLIEKREKDTQKVGLASLIATVGLVSGAGPGSADAVLNQFYATGEAASYLAAQPKIREVIGVRVLGDDEYKKAVENLKHDIQDIRSLDREFSGRASDLVEKLPDPKVDAGLDLAVTNGLMQESEKAAAGTTPASKKAYLKDIAKAGDNRDRLAKLMKFVDGLDGLVQGGN